MCMNILKHICLKPLHEKKDYLRKFRIQFARTKFKTAEENCLSCVKELGKIFQVLDYAAESSSVNGSSRTKSSTQDLLSQSIIQPSSSSGYSSRMGREDEPRQTQNSKAVNLQSLTKVTHLIKHNSVYK
jgi:hypothetical protein